ncbi:hypothetical protein F0L68_17910 [Solihabitans fulvus]|uniref:Prenyltransferase and squalene oxidase repeat-containing protein n=1 Tax=Solihabitans fulvus TaxID=1892852 RepID=A0A5B2XC80_9PSEU|nr:hypothetical protein [Solihabitans fulvus]KAA2261318.1 hypothetical protein F0L68_17910 [Solihabitans fulvus]
MIERAKDFIWHNARVLEQHRFACHFGPGDTGTDAVLRALLAYQNPDGGFGHALEPDGRGPSSQPLHVFMALRLLDEVGLADSPTTQRMCDYLASVSTPDGGVPNVHPAMRDHPRAPWWVIQDDPPGAILPTGLIVGLLHKNRIEHPWLAPATEFCWRAVDAITDPHPYEVGACVDFLDHAPDRDRAERTAERLGAMVRERRLVDLGDGAPRPEGYAEGEVHKPHDYARTPDSLARRWFTDAEFERSLDDLAAGQQEDGAWRFFWTVWTPVTEFEWRPVVTIDALLKLRAFGRL